MRHLLLIGFCLTPILVMAQAGAPQFVLAVPDGSGYVSPGADGELIVSKTPRGTFLMLDAAARGIGTLPKSAQLIQLVYCEVGYHVRAVTARERLRVSAAFGPPGNLMEVHLIVVDSGKPKMVTGALQDGSLIALTTESGRRFTRGHGGVITLEPARKDGALEKTQYFRLEVRDVEKAVRERAALDEQHRRNLQLSQPNNVDAKKMEVNPNKRLVQLDPPPDHPEE